MKRSLTFIVPALNEEGNIAGTVKVILESVPGRLDEWEILLIDDGSTDGTGAIMEELAASTADTRVERHQRNLGLGAAYRRGVELARREHLMLVPGDNQFPASSIGLILDMIGRADIVIPYTSNMEIRPLARQIISHAYTGLLNLLFGHSIRYYNGTVLHRTDLVRSAPITTDGFAYQTEILVRLLRRGATYVEVGLPITERQAGRSAAFKPRNVVAVVTTIARLLWEIYGLRTAPAR